MTDSLRFACTGCGKCCTGHHVPLTLAEARRWADNDGQVVVLIEAFVADGPGMPVEQRDHVLRRSHPVPCGDSEVRVSVTFAAFNPGRCRNLDDNDLCTIYDQRPLVCRIYPVEINPHIPLRPGSKDCPPEAWQQGPQLIHGRQLVDAALHAHLSVVAHTPQEPVCNARRSPRAGTDFDRALVGDLNAEDMRAAHDDLPEGVRVVHGELFLDTEAIAQR